MSEQAMDLRSATAVLRRRMRWVITAGLIGLAAGVAFVFLQPPRMQSTALVLLPTPTLEQAQPSVETQERIVLSSNVLGQAGRKVSPPLSARTMIKRIKVTAPTTQLIQIKAYAPRAADAEKLAQGVADAYVSYIEVATHSISGAALDELRRRGKALQKQVTALQQEIDTTTDRRSGEGAGSSDERKDAQLLAQLQAEQADVSLQLDKVKDEIASSAPTQTSSGGGTSVIEDATPALGQSRRSPLLLWGTIGLVLGVLFSILAILSLARRDPRLRLRDEIADALGSTVLASVVSWPQKSVAGWSALL